LTLEDNDPVGEVGCHDEIVLDDERSLLRVQDETLDNLGGDNTLLGVEEAVRREEKTRKWGGKIGGDRSLNDGITEVSKHATHDEGSSSK
jgi:hypothetical protein